MKLKEKAILFAPMVLILSMICASTYANVPKNKILDQAFLTDKTIYLKDKNNNHWQVKADCSFDLKLSDDPKITLHANTLSKGKRITVRTKNNTKNCRVDSLVKL